jgi:hypothetical protein
MRFRLRFKKEIQKRETQSKLQPAFTLPLSMQVRSAGVSSPYSPQNL